MEKRSKEREKQTNNRKRGVNRRERRGIKEREKERERVKERMIAAQRVTMVPDASVTLNTAGVREGTRAGMSGEALATVTHPRLAEVTYCSL